MTELTRSVDKISIKDISLVTFNLKNDPDIRFFKAENEV